MNCSPHQNPPLPAPAGPTGPTATILVVDDNPTNLNLLHSALSEHGYRVLIAEDGRSAIERAELATPDLILLDVMMPGIDGFDTCRRIKEIPTAKHIPVVFLSAVDDAAYRNQAKSAGGNGYLGKPVAPDILLHAVRQQLQNRMPPTSAAQPPAAPTQSTDQPPAAPPPNAMDWVSWIDTVAHDMRGQLSITEGFLHILKEAIPDCADPQTEAGDYVRTIGDATVHMNRIIESLIIVRALPQRVLQLKQISLKEAVEHAADAVELLEQCQWSARSGNCDCTVVTDSILLDSVLQTLIGTLARFRDPAAPAPMQLAIKAMSNACYFSIEATGRQLTGPECHHIFNTDIGDRSKRVQGIGVTIMGAAMVMRRIGIKPLASATATGSKIELIIPHAIPTPTAP